MSDFGPLIDQTRISTQRSARTGKITRVIWHHQAGTNDDAAITMMVTGSRQVSSTYTVDNKDFRGRGWARITGVVPERFRPWTSSSPAGDGQAITIEAANSTGAPGWGISPFTVEACARIAAYAFTAYGVPLRRATRANPSGHLGHNEVLGMFGQGYATACPLHLPIDQIINRARELVNGPAAATTPRSDMTTLYKNNDAKPDRWALAGDQAGTTAGWIETTNSGLAAGWAKVHGGVVGVSQATFTNFKTYYLMPVAIRGTVSVATSPQSAQIAAAADAD